MRLWNGILRLYTMAAESSTGRQAWLGCVGIEAYLAVGIRCRRSASLDKRRCAP
jgi:hypothetical protein